MTVTTEKGATESHPKRNRDIGLEKYCFFHNLHFWHCTWFNYSLYYPNAPISCDNERMDTFHVRKILRRLNFLKGREGFILKIQVRNFPNTELDPICFKKNKEVVKTKQFYLSSTTTVPITIYLDLELVSCSFLTLLITLSVETQK